MGQTSSTPSTSPSSSTMRSGRRNTSGTSAPPPSTPQTRHSTHNNSSSSPTDSTDNNSNTHSNSNNPALTPQHPSPPHQLPPSSPSRVLRSTTERRRRTNLFSSFYPLLSRSSSTPNSAAASGGSSSSQSNGSVVSGVTNVVTTSNNTGSSSSSRPTARTEWPTSRTGAALNTSTGPVSRTATRSPGLQPLNSPSSSRTPRGLSRVQRMYDEQSVRSHSSSRASSIVAANPPAHAFVNAPALPNSVEFMDVDMESVDGSPHTPSSAAGESLSGSVQPSAIAYENHMASSSQAGHAMVSSTEQPPSRNLSHTGTTRIPHEPTSSASTAFEHPPLFALANPRGGTSISSSLLPIRPDSDDDDDMEHELTNDHIAVAQGDAQTQAHPHLARMRMRRNFDPAIVADLIHDQIVQSLGGATAGTAPASMERPSEPVEIMQDSHHHQQVMDSSDTQASANVDSGSGSSSALNIQGEAPRATLHRRRRRSSSMRGLLGFQPTDEQTEGERSNSQASRPEGAAADQDANTSTEAEERPANGADRAQFLLSQLPVFLRLIADFSRGMRPATGTEGGEAESDGNAPNTPTLANGESESVDTDTTTVTGSETPASTTDPADSADARPRRRHTTIRLIQIGGIPGSRRRSRQATTANGNENSGENEGRDENGGQAGEDVGEAVIMLITEGPPHADAVSGNPSDESESGRERHRHLSPWIVMTFSGAYVSSVMADGAEGANYEDLWRLANIIGPARPVTTTQEAIDSAGFSVGTFDREVQGMRNITTLGDTTKCLVCMSDYEEGENMRALKCNHGFHQECIDKWLTTGANKCPICRAAAVVTESESPVAETEGTVQAALHEE